MRSSWAVAVAALLVVLATPTPAAANDPGPGAVVAPVRLVPGGAEVLRVAGLGSYLGELRLGSAADGLVVVNRLPLEDYLLGINEVPPGWPQEALRAQAIAARTYALWTLQEGRVGAAASYGFDICASVQCQVFSGASALQSATGGRWVQAVRHTAGIAVLYQGEPILARYHSVSGGATLSNPQAFPGEESFPYLRAVPSPYESASPLWRWRVRFRIRHLQRILERAGWWEQQGRLRRVATSASAQDKHYPDVVFSGTSGTLIRSAEEFRDMLRTTAPALYRGKYPPPAPLAAGRLPETLPSNRIEVDTSGRSVRVLGRGWGHGVGMSQWGAHGFALRGLSHAEILEHYYPGTMLGRAASQGAIDVGLDWGHGSVSVFGDFRLVDGNGRTLVRNALGTWTFHHAGSGAISVVPPEGFGLPLEVGIVRRPPPVAPGRSVSIEIVLSRPAHVRIRRDRPQLVEAGRRSLTWTAPESPGRYRVRVRASAGTKKRTDSVHVVVVEPPEPVPRTGTGDGTPAGVVPAAAILAVVTAVAAATIVRIRPWSERR